MLLRSDRALCLRSNFIWAGMLFVFIYWLAESAAHSLFFGKKPFYLEVFYPDRHELWMRFMVVALLVFFCFYSQKIVKRLKRAELAINERERETHRILENNPAAILLVDCITRNIIYANNNALELIGASQETLLGQKCHNVLCKSEKGECPIIDLGQPMDISERELLTADKRVIPVLKRVTTMQYNGKPHLLEAFFDITRQKEMQLALEQAHAEMNRIFQTATVGMRIIDNNFNIIKVNETFSVLSGVPAEEAVGKKCYEVFSGSKCHGTECSLRCVLAGRTLEEYEVSKVRADGSTLICNLTITPFEMADGTKGVVEAFQDISELKRIQNELLSERDKLHRLLFHQFETIGIINDQYLLEYQNELLKKQTGSRQRCFCYDIFLGTTSPCNDCYMLKAMSTQMIQRAEFDTASGTSFEHTYTPFIDNDGQQKVLVSRRDITERKTSEAAAMWAERLAALGELAAGVAHEINNPINGIINYGQILVNRAQGDGFTKEISGRIMREGDRVATIVANLLSFARRDCESFGPVNIKSLLDELLFLIAVQLKKDGIVLSLTIEDGVPPVFAIGNEIQQVFLNIINNSRHALNEKYPGSSTEKRLEIDVRLAETEGKEMVRTSFTDYGVGMSPAQLEKVCKPFFTTKAKGKGTGLGLTISSRIVEKHRGTLDIASVVDEYTRVVVDLTAYSGELEPRGQPLAQAMQDAAVIA